MSAPAADARKLAAMIVAGRLAACVNIIAGVESVYWWNDEVAHDEESLLVVKTTRPAVEPLIEAIRAVHPYENFELIALDIATGSQPYLEWIAASVSGAPEGGD